MKLANYKACICEGSAEEAIMDILLDHHLLIFERDEMLEGKVIRCRDGKKFEDQYLRKGYVDKISIIRILDSRREKYKLSKAYQNKVDVILLQRQRLKCSLYFMKENIMILRSPRKVQVIFAKLI